MNKQKTVIVIAGPTASGKTAVSLQLAKQLGTEIISADSRQCYQELNIGVARPSPKELEAIPHYFIATHSIKEEVTAAGFESYALEKANELFKDHDHIVMVGGTGLYIKAFCEGLDEIPPVPPAIREKIISDYKKKGLDWIQQEIKKKDPLFFKTGEIQNPQRIMRALEVVEATGQSIFSFRKNSNIQRPFQIRKIGISISKEELHRNINNRADQMIEKGLVNEVRNLQQFRHFNALQTVGYTELFKFLDNKISLDTAVQNIKTHTKQYAKRQITWFKKDPEIKWMTADTALTTDY